MASPLQSIFLVARASLALNLAKRRVIWLAILLVIPSTLSLLNRFHTTTTLNIDFSTVSAGLLLQFFCIGLSLFLAVSFVRDDVDDRTVTYFLVRPVTRQSLFLGKTISAAAVVWTWLVVSALLSWLLVRAGVSPGSDIPDLKSLAIHVTALGAGAVIYSGLFALAGIWLSRPFVICLVFSLAWEVTASNLPGRMPKATIMYYLKSVLGIGPGPTGIVGLLVPSVEPLEPWSATCVLAAIATVVYIVLAVTAPLKEQRL